ncbi:hypothetical protein BLNAU_17694 [Blattamonas nauphoetae]|uniref:Uncharacterized protein n=1 Tax=Blattamonas nauphoetae TaxID=2049346 RepID=A0ABQ9X6J4_9EUKA|nr:hypothetical protein BLNAU_17694 [Blattamonas nauphoetae]
MTATGIPVLDCNRILALFNRILRGGKNPTDNDYTQIYTHNEPGTPIETSVVSNDFSEDIRQLVSSVDALKEQNEILRKRVDQLESDLETSKQSVLVQQKQNDLQNEKLADSKSEVEKDRAAESGDITDEGSDSSTESDTPQSRGPTRSQWSEINSEDRTAEPVDVADEESNEPTE